MPVIRVASQAPTAMALTANSGTATQRLRRASATRPAPTWAMEQRMNSRANCGCSACTPAAAAWMTPAPIDAMAATVNPGTRVVDRPPESASDAANMGSTISPSPGTARVMWRLYEERVTMGDRVDDSAPRLTGVRAQRVERRSGELLPADQEVRQPWITFV